MTRKKILIAEDDPILPPLYAELLGDGYDYLYADNGVDAIVTAVDEVPDLVILDVAMPQLDGRTICHKLKSYPKTKDIKVLMITGRSEQSDRLVGFEVGADEYLVKPASRLQIVHAVDKLLR